MRRLAFAFEGLVSVAPERENRAAAGFVAGTAHHVAILATRVTATAPRPSVLGFDGISPESPRLYSFSSQRPLPNAAETSKAIVVQTDDAVERALLEAVRHLANGRLAQLLDVDTPSPDVFLQTHRREPGRQIAVLHAAPWRPRDGRADAGPTRYRPLYRGPRRYCSSR